METIPMWFYPLEIQIVRSFTDKNVKFKKKTSKDVKRNKSKIKKKKA